MRALLIRFRRFTGFRGALALVGGVLAAIVLASGTPTTSNARGMVVIAVAGVAMAAAGAVGYRRSSATDPCAEVLPRLMRSDREYCLVLRAFGRDGEFILPAATGKRQTTGRFGFTQNVTIEQVVADAARDALGVETYGIVDQSVAFAPPGLRFLRASDDEWQMVAQRLIRRAHSIVVIVAPGQDVREGLAWEIAQIVRYGRRPRVVLVLPPAAGKARAREHALGQVAELLKMLGADAPLDPSTVDRGTVVMKCSQGSDVWLWSLDADSPGVVADVTYRPGLVAALEQNERELAGCSFEARYA